MIVTIRILTWSLFNICLLVAAKSTAQCYGGKDRTNFIKEKVLSLGKDSTNKSAYIALASNFCYVKATQEEFANVGGIEKVYQLIETYKSLYNEPYIKLFLLNESRCFSSTEYNTAKNFLIKNLNTNSPYFYDLVSSYKLYQFEIEIRSRADSSWFSSLTELLNNSPATDEHTEQVLKTGAPHIVLANLGDTLIEDKIINILLERYRSFNLANPDKKEFVKQRNFYTDILPKTLGKLTSKRSVVRTLEMIENYWRNEDFFKEYDLIEPPLYAVYSGIVIGRKLTPPSEKCFEWYMTALSGEDKTNQRLAIHILKEDILDGGAFTRVNHQHPIYLLYQKWKWSTLYNYWVEEKRK